MSGRKSGVNGRTGMGRMVYNNIKVKACIIYKLLYIVIVPKCNN